MSAICIPIIRPCRYCGSPGVLHVEATDTYTTVDHKAYVTAYVTCRNDDCRARPFSVKKPMLIEQDIAAVVAKWNGTDKEGRDVSSDLTMAEIGEVIEEMKDRT